MWPQLINTAAQWKSDIQSIIITFCIEETGLPAGVHHFLLALLWPWHDGTQLFSRGAVVEPHDVGFLNRGALDCDWSCAVVGQHRPHLLLWKEELNMFNMLWTHFDLYTKTRMASDCVVDLIVNGFGAL